jgi:hypothetical protein
MEIRCEARFTGAAPLAAAARLHLAMVAELLDAGSGIVAIPAGATREQASHAVRVSSRFAPSARAPAATFIFVLRVAESLVAWTDVAARARDSMERALVAAGGWGLLSPGVQVEIRGGGLIDAPSSAFQVTAPIRAQHLVVSIELAVSPATRATWPVLYLAGDGTAQLAWDFCGFGDRGCAAAVAALPTHTTVRGSSAMTGPFWADSNASLAQVLPARGGTGAQVRIAVTLHDLTAHNFTMEREGGVLSATFYVGVVFVKRDAGGRTLHFEDVRVRVRAEFDLTHTVVASYASESTLEVPIEIALYRVFDAERAVYNDSAEVALFVGTPTADAIAQHPVLFASSLRVGFSTRPENASLTQACAPPPAPPVLVRAARACAQPKVSPLLDLLVSRAAVLLCRRPGLPGSDGIL